MVNNRVQNRISEIIRPKASEMTPISFDTIYNRLKEIICFLFEGENEIIENQKSYLFIGHIELFIL